jgi:hypothetical protein
MPIRSNEMMKAKRHNLNWVPVNGDFDIDGSTILFKGKSFPAPTVSEQTAGEGKVQASRAL